MGRVQRADYAQRFLLPPSLDEWVPPEHPARFVRDFVDELDLKALGIRERSGEEGRPPYAADLLLKVWLFGWMERERSTRRLEKACLQVMPFLWLTGNLHPDHNTIWRFFNDNRKVLPKLFKQIVTVAKEAGLIGFALHALDGTKMTAASSTDTARHRKSLEEMLKDVDAIIEAYVREVETQRMEEEPRPGYGMPELMRDPSARREKIRALLEQRLDDSCDRKPAKKEQSEPQIDPCSDDRTKDEATGPTTEATADDTAKPQSRTHAEALLKEAQTLKAALLEQRVLLDAANTDHLHLKETDARMMKGRGMHALGYNAQAVADHDSDLIVASDVLNQQNDQGQLVPMLVQTRENLGKTADQNLGDGGYCSGEQLSRAQEGRIAVLVKIPEEVATKGEFRKSQFRYDAEKNVYCCPQGEQLVQIGTSKAHATSIHSDAIYRCHNTTCSVRSECTKSKGGRKIRRPHFESALEQQKQTQAGPPMRILLSLRKEIIEHIFGIIKWNDGFRRFTVRGLEKVRAQWALACSAVNLRKLYAFWREGGLKLGSLANRATLTTG